MKAKTKRELECMNYGFKKALEQRNKEILEIIDNTNWADILDGTSYDVIENEVAGYDTIWSKEMLNNDLKQRIKQQLTNSEGKE